MAGWCKCINGIFSNIGGDGIIEIKNDEGSCANGIQCKSSLNGLDAEIHKAMSIQRFGAIL